MIVEVMGSKIRIQLYIYIYMSIFRKSVDMNDIIN